MTRGACVLRGKPFLGPLVLFGHCKTLSSRARAYCLQKQRDVRNPRPLPANHTILLTLDAVFVRDRCPEGARLGPGGLSVLLGDLRTNGQSSFRAALSFFAVILTGKRLRPSNTP